MAIKRPDEYEHANPAEPIVRSSNVKGGALKTADLTTLLTDFVGLESKLIEGVTKVYVESEDADYRLKNIAAVNLLASWSKVVTGAGGGASSFAELEGNPSDNEALGADLTRIEDKADGAQADFDYLATVVDTKLTGTKASDAELEAQAVVVEDNKFVSRRGLFYWWTWVKTQAFTLGGLITFGTAPKLNSLTANRILSLDANKNIEDILQKILPVITNSTVTALLNNDSNWRESDNAYIGPAISTQEQTQYWKNTDYWFFLYDSGTPVRIPIGGRIDHLRGRTSTPSISAGAAAGTTPSISISGTDLGFRITLTVGTSPTTGTLATVTFNRPYGSAPFVVTSPKNTNAAALSVRPYNTTTTTTLTLSVGTALTASTQYIWDFIIAQ
ncbi:hypothetical protein [Pedobacter sp. SL55]|uniref:hypothetical protein n=1 Tax=Pedobacter sp. SL55 TaxID=2995161 RepID=UPI00226E17BB|nr:hypothetical protein [Pedobacter sp. SL55]WAC40596.1 hypothetical protein OVA16_18825 [Pedobacter sp. SL55]